MSPSAIEWTEETWNPTVGCSRVSPGCDRCYAISVAHRGLHPAHAELTERTADGLDWTGEVRCLPERLEVPLRRLKPTVYFVDSMSDLFHPQVPFDFVGRVFDVMMRAEQHVFQVLTKRPQRMRRFVDAWLGESWAQYLPNVWLGTSIESDTYAWRADHLRATPAEVRFLSLEPLLGPLPSLSMEGIDWVIVGGESGRGARPMHPSWVRDIRNRCVAGGVPLFFKQWGEWAPIEPLEFSSARGDRVLNWAGDDDRLGGGFVRRLGKKAAGRELDGRTWDEMPERVSA